MSFTWLPAHDGGCILNVNGKHGEAYVQPVGGEVGGDEASYYRARLRSSEQRFFATLEEAKTWCEKPTKLREVEEALDGERSRPLQYLTAFLNATSMVASGSSKVNSASRSGTAP